MPVSKGNVAPKIADLGIVDIDTTTLHLQSDPGFSGVAVVTKGQSQSLHTCYSLSDVAGSFDTNSYVYKAASNYFMNPNATTFQVITYPATAPSVSASDFNFDAFKSAITNNLTRTTSADMFNSIKNNFSSLFSLDNDTVASNLGDIGTEFASGHPTASKVNSDLSNISSELSSLSTEKTDPAVAALTKYYGCGAEFFVFEVASDADKQTAIDLSNLVEGQHQNVLFLDQPTDGIATDADFSWYINTIKDNESTELFSLPFSGDPSDYQFVSAVLSQYAGSSPASNLELTTGLPNVTPQDRYAFSVYDFNVYRKAGIVTYCYRNNIPMLSSGNSADGYQVSNLITRDYLNDEIRQEITNMLVNHNRAGSPIHFDQSGVDQIIGSMNLVLNSAAKAHLIKNAAVNPVNVAKIPETVKEEGTLNALSYHWAPNNNINHIEFHQEINLPMLANA